MESQKNNVPNRQPDKSSQYYPLVNEQFATDNCPVEIVDLPSYKMVIFHSHVSLPEGISM